MIERIIEQWDGCERCTLSRKRDRVVVGSGPSPCNLMVIGEGPGEEEDRTGLPFQGISGEFLSDQFNWATSRFLNECAYITNIVGCRPPQNRVPMPDEIQACRPRLDALVNVVRPQVILLLGGSALMSILGKQGITRARGKWTTSEWTWKKRKIKIDTLATFHPAGLLPSRLREPIDLERFKEDLKTAYDRAYE